MAINTILFFAFVCSFFLGLVLRHEGAFKKDKPVEYSGNFLLTVAAVLLVVPFLL